MPMTRRAALSLPLALAAAPSRNEIAIDGERFLLNGKPTYPGRQFEGMRIEGLLLNSRMVQGIFDDENPATVSRWKYPDTGKWDPERNTREFIAAMPEWRKHGLLSFNISLQGGSPEGYSKEQPWLNNAFQPDGKLKPAYMKRLARILDKADELGMVPQVCLFYFGQDEHFRDDAAIRKAVEEAVGWIFDRGYRNVLLEIANESNNRSYQKELMKPPRVVELINQAKKMTSRGRRLLVSTSFNGGIVPPDEVMAVTDFVLMHGNGVKIPARIEEMCKQARALPSYKTKPVMFNEDDHFDFDKPENNMRSALKSYASWGYFDPGKNDYVDGYQSVPVNWGINTERKKAFFAFVKQVAGA